MYIYRFKWINCESIEEYGDWKLIMLSVIMEGGKKIAKLQNS